MKSGHGAPPAALVIRRDCRNGLWQGTQPQRPTFRAGVRTVAVYATVQDRQGRLVPDVTRDDFEVRDNGRPIELTVFSNEQLPITVVVMLDMSNSMQEEFEHVRVSALHFVQALGPSDRARIGTFGDEVAVSPLLTGEKDVLSRVLSEELWPGGGTPLWSGLFAAMASITTEPGRRVVLTLTDGDDACDMRSSSLVSRMSQLPALPVRRAFGDYCSTLPEVRMRALREEFMIYAIGMPSLNPEMSELSADTGGGYFNLRRKADLAETFARVVEELHHQYLLGFIPAVLDGTTHTLDVRLKRPGLTARARKSYVAEGR